MISTLYQATPDTDWQSAVSSVHFGHIKIESGCWLYSSLVDSVIFHLSKQTSNPADPITMKQHQFTRHGRRQFWKHH